MHRPRNPRRRRIVALLLLGAGVAAARAARATESGTAEASSDALALVGGRIYPAPDELPIFDGTVIVAAGKIAALGRRQEVPVPAGAKVIDCKGLVVTAGFQNSHVHFTEPKWADAGRQPAAQLTRQLQDMLTRWGYTTVVDTASAPENTVALRRRIDAGEVAGPRILTAGGALYPPDGVPFYVKDAEPAEVVAMLAQPATAAAAAAVVRRNHSLGADVTKLFTGSWVARGKVLPMPVEVAAAAAAESHRTGKLVMSHPSNVAGLEVALAAGADILAHAVDDTRGFTREHLRQMKARDLAVVPTFKLLAGPWLFEVQDFVREHARAGGQILFGTDVGYLTDYDPTEEVILMSTAGFSWREILVSLTTAPAARFGEAGRRGRLAAGMDADLVVLANDPVRDVRAFTQVVHTVRGGRLIYSAPPSPPPPPPASGRR
jgi:imidazolonepropionase-like amidohydrolase